MDKQALWYVGGQWVHPHEAMISINDVAVLRGYSAFEALRTYNSRPFHLGKHLTRLYRSAELIELEIPCSRESLAAIIREVIERNTYKHAAIRIILTEGANKYSSIHTWTRTIAV